MSVGVATALALVCLAGGLAAGLWLLPPHRRQAVGDRPGPVRRILLPFTGQAISRRAFDAALRLAKAENATIMPAFLARVPRTLPLEAPLPAACAVGMPLLEAIEQGAGSQGVQVDARVVRGRTYRDALRHLVEQERFDRIIVSATDSPRNGLTSGDIEWLLERVPAEVMILRPAPDDTRVVTADDSQRQS
ncbi:MAG TPA: universal stress protein [Solirubrobacteraceae bacterium]|nr:universal stress protein [Solirubrobacteraceae bacterium]